MYKTQEQKNDKFRQSLLEWVLDLGDGTVKELRDMENYQQFAVVILTLQYLVQV